MNDLTVNMTEIGEENYEQCEKPFAAIFALEQELFKNYKTKTLDLLESGQIRFQHKQSFDPHELAIESQKNSKQSGEVELHGALLSLTGANGVLPNHYSETLAKNLRDKNSVLKDFLNIFSHRINTLMYRSWGKYRLDTDKSYQANLTQYQSTIDLMLTSLAGESFPKDERSTAYFAGLTFASTRSTQKLINIIHDLSGLKVSINEFKGKWIELGDDQLSRMKNSKFGQGFNQLGVNTMLGRRCWDLSSGFEVEFDVGDEETFVNLTPGGAMNELLSDVIKKIVGDGFDFNFKLKVDSKHCQSTQLSKDGFATKLGTSAWMGQNSDRNKTIDYYC